MHGLLKIFNKIFGDPPYPPYYTTFGRTRGVISKVLLGFQGEMFEGDSADTCGGKFLFTLMGGRAVGLVCADPEDPINVRGNVMYFGPRGVHAPAVTILSN